MSRFLLCSGVLPALLLFANVKVNTTTKSLYDMRLALNRVEISARMAAVKQLREQETRIMSLVDE
jgi:hypothetical protein